MLKALYIDRYIDLADFEKLAEFLGVIGFVPTRGPGDALGYRSARLSAPVSTLALSSVPPESPPGVADHVRSLSLLVRLETSDPAPIYETARKMSLRVRLQDSAIDWSGEEPFTVELPGKILVCVNPVSPGPVPGSAGQLSAVAKSFGVVVARFNSFITERLLESSLDGLLRCGARREDIQVIRVPGAFEIPLAARKLAETGKYDAIICLGCLLRGDTAHYDVIVNEVTRGIGQSAQETGIPHAFGVLTCETLEQAIDRAGLKMGNKGFEAALEAVEMASLKAAIGLRASAVGKRAVGRQPSGGGHRSSAVGKKQIPPSGRNGKPSRNDTPKKIVQGAKAKRK